MTLTAPSRDLRLRRVDATLRASGAELVTFDLFDTLVFRRVDRPIDAFALVGRALREAGALGGVMTPAMFGAVRQAAEKRAREQRHALDGSVEVDLHDIYNAFPRWPLDRAVTVDDLVATEVEVERGLLVPDLEVVSFLEGVKAEGTRIAGVMAPPSAPASRSARPTRAKASIGRSTLRNTSVSKRSNVTSSAPLARSVASTCRRRRSREGAVRVIPARV
ncbi:MAG: hypothetical protein M3401_18890 [Actinomycetota bacterium]|nr:hypothetical protein [Actinomycetota bacterium]